MLPFMSESSWKEKHMDGYGVPGISGRASNLSRKNGNQTSMVAKDPERAVLWKNTLVIRARYPS